MPPLTPLQQALSSRWQAPPRDSHRLSPRGSVFQPRHDMDRCTKGSSPKMLWVFQQRKQTKKKREVSDVFVSQMISPRVFLGTIGCTPNSVPMVFIGSLGPDSFKIILRKILELPFQDHRLASTEPVESEVRLQLPFPWKWLFQMNMKPVD